MISIFRFFKYTITALFITAVAIYACGYVLLSMPFVQQRAKEICVRELRERLHTDIRIDKVSIRPFNKIALHDIYLPDQQGDTLLYSNKLAAGFELFPLLKKRLVFNNIQFFGFNIYLNKKHPGAPLNAQFVIEAFQRKEPRKDRNIDLKIKSILIRRGKIKYDVLSEPRKAQHEFDPHHIEIRNLLSTLSLKALTADTLNAQIKRLSGEERSGAALQRLALKISANRQQTVLSNLELRLPKTQIHIDSASIDYARVDTLTHFNDSASLYLNLVNSEVVLSDLAAFAPALKKFELPMQVDFRISGVPDMLSLNFLRMRYSNSIRLNAEGSISGITTPQSTYLFGKVQELYVSSSGVRSVVEQFNPTLRSEIIDRLGSIRFSGEVSGFFDDLVTYGQLRTPHGTLHTDMLAGSHQHGDRITYKGRLSTRDFDLGALTGRKKQFDKLSFNIDVDGQQTRGKGGTGKVNGQFDRFDLNSHTYENIRIDGEFSGTRYNGKLAVDDPDGQLELNGLVDWLDRTPVFRFNATGNRIRLNDLHLTDRYPGSELSFHIDADFSGRTIDQANGSLTLRNCSFSYNDNRFVLDSLSVDARNDRDPQSITVASDLLNGEIVGEYSLKTFPASVHEMLADALPSVFKKPDQGRIPRNNDFRFQFKLSHTGALSRTLELPFVVNDSSFIKGFFSDKQQTFRIEAAMPDARFKNSKLQNTQFVAEKQHGEVILRAGTDMVNRRNKYILLALNGRAADDLLSLRLNWSNIGTATFSGSLTANTLFSNDEKHDNLTIRSEIAPSTLIMNDTVWNVLPARITIDSSGVDIRNFEIRHQSQFLKIDGKSSRRPDDLVHLKLNDMNLGYIFETVNIRHVTFGGKATGDFLVSNLNVAPRLTTDNFRVIDFSYNDAPLGNLSLKSSWNNAEKGIALTGTISQPGQEDTRIDGLIYPTRDKSALSLQFDTRHLNLEFLRPFVGKIMQDLSGHVSGKVRLFGKFSALNVIGDTRLQNTSFGIDYLNTRYTIADDSLHLREDGIFFNDITLSDARQQTASVSGQLRYSHFKNLTYDIALDRVTDFTVFNITERQNPVYFGTVYGSGAGTIQGNSEHTDIDVNLQINQKSLFTFVLSDNETADDYRFITFVNKRELLNKSENDSARVSAPTIVPAIETPHRLNINLQIDVTPDGTVQLIIDPATGDMIKANGNGNLRLEYNTFDRLKLYGTYTLEKGNYNFSLQDLITRDFTIRPGSTVSFKGEPLSADLDISASYTVTANLQDLDETFADDKELTRTNVPVQTILNISGNLQRPDLKFDIEMPSLSQDIERKVRSIVNTDDMMNRQIIYLLALGRFYTPDYMNIGQNRNNELASVASSTLSSQLNNLLGQISDNWNIGTQIRSDKGDFSDVEFELALSSQLLNNRLIFNGNFGYRDNTTSNNTFIGDFDLEYLLNRNGNLRFKAYNHYNDRNYYIKSALTTQGIGLVFKRDFSTLHDLFRIARSRKKDAPISPSQRTTSPPDSTLAPPPVVPHDSIR